MPSCIRVRPGVNISQDPSGSSSGSAVSSSIGLAFAALGTETDGSIVSPSEMSSLVGIKPSVSHSFLKLLGSRSPTANQRVKKVGLTSRYLVIPISEHQDTVGPIARTVRDAAALLQVIAGQDISNDNYTSEAPNPLPDYVAACNFSALQGARLGVPYNALALYEQDYPDIAGPVLATFNKMLGLMKAAGATIVVSGLDIAFSTLNATSF